MDKKPNKPGSARPPIPPKPEDVTRLNPVAKKRPAAGGQSPQPPQAQGTGSGAEPRPTYTFRPSGVSDSMTRLNEVPPKNELRVLPPPPARQGHSELEKLDQQRRQRESRESRKYEKGMSGVLAGITKAIVYILMVAAVSVILAYNIIMMANDVFAFVKPADVTTVILPENPTLKDVAATLKASSTIKYPGVFELYASLRKKTTGYKAGSYTLSSALNYDEIMGELRKMESSRSEVRITIIEGMTTDQIIDLFVSKGIGSKAKFKEVINNYNFKYDFLPDPDGLSPDRKYRLEGYLFPDTYDFYIDSKEEAVISKLLDNFDQKFNENFRLRCKTLGMSIDQVVNLASIVQAEARFIEDFDQIASVFHNRLNNPQNYPYLESDATIQYAFDKRKSEITPQDLEMEHPYNTYKNPGLPPSAVGNPGLAAINAVLYCDKTENYYFVADKNGKTYYAKTYAEHIANTIFARKQ